ncbi:MAG: GNAT family N-acetyltransferase [Prolixibacteraceae bacterium]
MMVDIQVKLGNIQNESDASDMLRMLSVYMHDPMGGEQSLSDELAKKNIDGLKKQSNYVFFLAYCNDELAGFANCFINFSTFKAQQLINIHDFAVDPSFRRKGLGIAMINRIAEYCQENGLCKITLEVRFDNPGAQKLYKKLGFEEGEPAYHFWEKVI